MRSVALGVEAELGGDLLAVAADGLRVQRGAGVAQVERLGEHEHGGGLLDRLALLDVAVWIEPATSSL